MRRRFRVEIYDIESMTSAVYRVKYSEENDEVSILSVEIRDDVSNSFSVVNYKDIPCEHREEILKEVYKDLDEFSSRV